MKRIDELEKRLQEAEENIKKLQKRNQSVELNKAWEVSYTRKVLIVLFTYLSISLYLKFIVGINPWINALVPAVGFVLSTLTFPWFKKQWAKYVYKK